jgi:hypothetical protein
MRQWHATRKIDSVGRDFATCRRVGLVEPAPAERLVLQTSCGLDSSPLFDCPQHLQAIETSRGSSFRCDIESPYSRKQGHVLRRSPFKTDVCVARMARKIPAITATATAPVSPAASTVAGIPNESSGPKLGKKFPHLINASMPMILASHVCGSRFSEQLIGTEGKPLLGRLNHPSYVESVTISASSSGASELLIASTPRG